MNYSTIKRERSNSPSVTEGAGSEKRIKLEQTAEGSKVPLNDVKTEVPSSEALNEKKEVEEKWRVVVRLDIQFDRAPDEEPDEYSEEEDGWGFDKNTKQYWVNMQLKSYEEEAPVYDILDKNGKPSTFHDPKQIIRFINLGSKWCDYPEVLRTAGARIYLEKSNERKEVGSIDFIIIDRDFMQCRCNFGMHYLCDIDRQDLYDLSEKYFNDNGAPKGLLKKRILAQAGQGGYIDDSGAFSYITKISMNEDYKDLSLPKNKNLLSIALTTFLHGDIFHNPEEEINLMTVLFVRGWEGDGFTKMPYKASIEELEVLKLAGFEELTNGCMFVHIPF